MSNLWDDIAKTIREGVDTVVEKTEELTKIGRLKVDIINIKRNIDKNFSELGGKVYDLLVEQKKTQIAGDAEVQRIIDSIKLLEKELQQKNAQIDQVKAGEGGGKSAGKPEPVSETTASPRTTAKAKTTSKSTKTKQPKTGSTSSKKQK